MAPLSQQTTVIGEVNLERPRLDRDRSQRSSDGLSYDSLVTTAKNLGVPPNPLKLEGRFVCARLGHFDERRRLLRERLPSTLAEFDVEL